MQSNARREETFSKLLTSLVTGVLFAALGACSSQPNDAVIDSSQDDGAYADAGSEATPGDADLSDDGMAESDVDVEASSEASAPDGDAPVPDGDYIIRAVHSDLCLDVPGGSVANGTKLQQWECNGTRAQTFHVSVNADGYYKITSVKGLRSLDVTDESAEPGAAIQQWDYWGGLNQQFSLEQDGEGVRIIARHSKMALQAAGDSVKSAAGIVQQPVDAGSGQLWQLILESTPPEPTTGFVHASGLQLLDGDGNELRLRGVALGNWLLPEGYMWNFEGGRGDRARRIEARISELLGPQSAESFWRGWRDNFITEADIARISGLGFNHVRLAINARLLLPEGQDAFVEPEFAYLTKLVDWCEQHQVYVILDMHGAPGGQTGKNIDDSPNDYPELFTDPINEDRLVALWTEIASRFATNTTVLGYDLLNEPLPGEFAQHNHQLWPLYVRLGAAIRTVDPNHTLIVEGANWANNWSALDAPFDDNMMYSFHKYWDSTDQASIQGYLDRRAQWQRPVWVGESGENDNDWYREAFSLFEDNDIGWCFWSWKKLESGNNPYGYGAPADWWQVQNYIKDASQKPSASVAQATLDQLLVNIQLTNSWYNADPVCAILPCP